MIDLIAATEAKLPHQHLISDTVYTKPSFKGPNPQSFPNRPAVNPRLNVLNLHGGRQNMTELYGLGKIVAEDENAHGCCAAFRYREACHSTLMRGAAVYNTIDYSVYVQHENGTGTPEFDDPSSGDAVGTEIDGSPELGSAYAGAGGEFMRRQVAQCQAFFTSLDLVEMRPVPIQAQLVGGGAVGEAAALRHSDGRQLALYVSVANTSIPLHSIRCFGMHQGCLLKPRNSVFYPFFTHFPPYFAHFLRLDAKNPGNTATSPGENGEKSGKIVENRGN